MNIFFILAGVSVVGILGVFWLLKNEDKPSLRDLAPPTPLPVSPAKKSSLLTGIFAKSKKEKKPSRENMVAEIPSPSVTDLNEKSTEPAPKKREVFSQEAKLPADEEKKIEQEISFSAQVEEWKEKYERLDKFFSEKSMALEKCEESLKGELNNRKEFNKVKDILEKELKEAKDKTRGIQAEWNAAKAEAEGHKKRINQLEEKVAKAEKAVLGKDDEIADLNRRLKAASSASAVIVAAPAPDLSTQPEPPPVPATTVPEVSVQAVTAPEQVASAELPPVAPPSPPIAADPEREKTEGAQPPVQKEGFLKLQPDILTVTNPPNIIPEPGTKTSEPGEPSQPEKSVPPEASPPDASQKADSDGEINKSE